MKHWIRVCFCRNYISFNSIGVFSYRQSFHRNHRSEKLYHKSQTYFCIKQQTPESFHQHDLNFELKDTPTPELLNGLHRCITNNTSIEPADDVQIGFDLHTRLMECAARLPLFTNDQLLDFMNSLYGIKFSSVSAFYQNGTIKQVLKLLDNECNDRLSSRDLNIILPMMEGFHKILTGRSSFMYNVINLYKGKIHRAPLDKFVRFVAVVNQGKYWNMAVFNQYEIEYQLEKRFHNLDIEQITTLTYALIQLKKPIISFELKKLLLSYVARNMNTHHYRLCNILDLFCSKASSTINMSSLTSEFLRLLRTTNDNFDTYSLNFIALVGMLTTKFLVHEPEFFEKLYRRFLAEGCKANKQTVDYIVYTLIFFDYRSSKAEENVYAQMCRQITNDKSLTDAYKHTKRYVRLISWFCCASVYDYDIINEILDEKYLYKTYKKLNRFNMYPYTMVVDFNVQIECPDYKGHRLSTALRKDLLRCYDWNFINDHFLTDCYTDPYQLTDDTQQCNYKYCEDLPYYDILKEISSKLNVICNEEISYVGYVLPHMPRPNLLFCLDENKQAQNLVFLKKESSTFVDWNGLDFRYKWYVVTVLIRNTFLPDTEAVPYGVEITKIRLFQKLNFNVVTVVQDQWLSMNEEEKIIFCTRLIR